MKAPSLSPIAPLLLSLSVILIALFVYLPTMAPTITWAHGGADSGELAAAVVTGGVAHPPGYPTYLLLASLWLMLPLASDAAYQLNLLSAISAALAAGLTARTILLLAESLPKRLRYGGALFGSLSLAFAPLVWSQALITEVYALGLFMVSLVTYFLMAWYKRCSSAKGSPTVMPITELKHTPNPSQEGSSRLDSPLERGWECVTDHVPLYQADFMLASLFFGLGLGVLPQLILLLPGAMGLYLSQVRGKGIIQVAREVCCSGLAVALGLSSYLLLPWRAAMQPRANWGDPVTLERFWQLVTASQYHHLVPSVTVGAWLSRLGDGILLLDQNLDCSLWVIGCLGMGMLWRKNRAVLGYLLTLVILTLCFRTSYAAIGNQVYLIPALYGLSILIGLGFASLFRLAPAESQRIVSRATVLLLVVLLATGIMMRSRMDISHEYDAALFGQDTFNTLPQDAIVVTERDEYTFALWYYQALGQRLDVVVIDSRLLFYEWYQEHLTHHYPDLNPAAVRPGGLTALERPLYQLSGGLGDDKLIKIK